MAKREGECPETLKPSLKLLLYFSRQNHKKIKLFSMATFHLEIKSCIKNLEINTLSIASSSLESMPLNKKLIMN